MRSYTARIFVLLCLLFAFTLSSFAQSGHRQRYPKTKPNEEQPKTPPKTGQPKPASQTKQKDKEKEEPLDVAPDPDAIKIDTEVVSVPVIASDRNDIYVPDLKREEFTLFEDGIKQEIVFFAPVKEPFNVVLMLDTSGSTQEKLRLIQSAAKEFVAQLQPQDRIRIISFDDEIHDLSEFTNDRAALRNAIDRTQSGKSTKMYDAMKYALNVLTRVKGRKAIVLFSDGVDSYSDSTRYDDNIAQLEEAGVIIYPIRYNTRAETEAMVRQQAETGTIGGQGPPPTTPQNRRRRVSSPRWPDRPE
jgi:Ca-activated chloride channel family protein